MTKIEWTERTWNPITGCTLISPGCQNCYARRMASRQAGRNGYPKDDPFAVTFHPDKIEQPMHWRKPCRIFPCSMGDLFHPEAIAKGFTDDVWNVMIDKRCRHHTFQVLTKRPAYAAEWLEDHPPFSPPGGWDNIWMGVTVEDQLRADERIPILLGIDAAVRFLSIEPCLSEIDLTEWLYNVRGQSGHGERNSHAQKLGAHPILDWVIVGAETGPGRRWCHSRWIAGVVKQCHLAAVPVFVKAIHINNMPWQPIVVRDINQISNQLGMAPHDLRQYPKGKVRA